MSAIGQQPPSGNNVQLHERDTSGSAARDTHRRRPPTEDELLQGFQLTASQVERAVLRRALAEGNSL